MGLDIATTAGWTYMGIVIWAIGSTICLVIFLYHTYVTITQDFVMISQQSKSAQKWSRATHMITIFTLFCFLVHSQTIAIYKYGLMLLSCDKFLKMAVSTYHIGKGIMYIILILRLKIAFGDSHLFAYPMSLIYALLAITLTVQTIVVILDIIFVVGTHEWFGNFFFCNAEPPIAIIGLALFNDIAVCIVTMTLFITKLRTVIASIQSQSSVGNDKLRCLLTKYTVLSMVALLSTVFFILIIPVFGSSVLTVFDVVINVICLCLLSARYDAIYQKLCCGALVCIRLCSGDARSRALTMMSRTVEVTTTTAKIADSTNLHLSSVDVGSADSTKASASEN